MSCSKCCECYEHLNKKIRRQGKTINCLRSNQRKIEKEIDILQCQMDEVLSVLHIDNGVTIGDPDNPIQNIYTENIGSNLQAPDNLHSDNIVNNDYSTKGICLDDSTALLTPSFDSFPESWIKANAPISMCRTYHYNLNTPNWIEWFVENNISVMVGITLADHQNELDTFSADYLAANSELKELYDIYIVAIGVGNERPIGEIADMNAGMQYAKGLRTSGDLPNGALITTVLEELPVWITDTFPPPAARFTNNFKLLIPEIEIVCFNMYDGYTNPGQPDIVRLSWCSMPNDGKFSITLNAFGAMRFAMEFTSIDFPKILDTPFWCTETGWESVPGVQGASIPNLETFYSNFLNFNMEEEFYPQGASNPSSPHTVLPPNRLFYFTVRDETLRNETFGLYTENTILTPKF